VFGSEVCHLIKKEFPLPVLNDETFDPSLTIEDCMDKLSNIEMDNLYKHTIESHMASKFTISDLIKAKKSNLDHPIFSSRFFLTSWLGPH
jgi:hypothetical protein